jgi:paraquat-inducible protein B
MGKRVNSAVIGGFVVASFAILVGALIAVGSGKMFAKPVRFICMFPGSLNGLRVGAPVKIRGVQIGTVAEIKLGLNPSDGTMRPGVKGLRLPVIIELDKSMLTARGAIGKGLVGEGFHRWIERGMRAQLNVESLLTGLLYVDLDLHPRTRPDLVLEPGGPYPEIPTVPTDLAQLQQRLTQALDKFEEIDFQGLVNALTDTANSIRSLTTSPELKATLESLKDATVNLNQMTIAARRLIDSTNATIGPLAADFRQSSQQANKTMEDTRVTLIKLQQTLDPNSPLVAHVNQSMESLDQTLRSLGELTDYLQRNPAALVRGRYVPDTSK